MKNAGVRIRNTSGHEMDTVVELVGPEGEVRDLTKEGLIHFPIQIVSDEEGVFALLRVPVSSFDVIARPSYEARDESAEDRWDMILGRRIRRLLEQPRVKLDWR
jgi:hypothetical protein